MPLLVSSLRRRLTTTVGVSLAHGGATKVNAEAVGASCWAWCGGVCRGLRRGEALLVMA